MAYLSWSDATERVAKGLHSYDWELEVVVEAGSAEDVPINIEGKEDGDEWLLEWSFDVSGGAVEFGIEVDEEVALDLTTLRSEMDDGIAEGRVMIDSRAQALLLVFENQRGFWFSSSETKRITGVVKIVRREMGGESAATGGGLMLSSSRGQFPARRRVRKKAKEGGRRKQPRAMRSERRMPRTVGGGGGGVRGGGRRKRRAKKGRPLLSSVSSCTTTTSSCSTSESGSGSSSESSGEEETSVTSAASEGTSGGGTEAGTLVTPEDYTEELEYMEAMLRFKEERHVQKTAPPPRGGVSGRAAQGTAKAKPSKPLRPKPQPPKARGGRPRRREGGRGRSSSRGGGGTEQRGVSGSAKEQALQRHCNELKAQVRDLSKFLASVEDDEEGRAAALERKLLEESAKSSAAEAKCAALEQDLELATTVSAKWRECCDRQRVALREASEEKAEALAAVAARVDKTSVSESERDAVRAQQLQLFRICRSPPPPSSPLSHRSRARSRHPSSPSVPSCRRCATTRCRKSSTTFAGSAHTSRRRSSGSARRSPRPTQRR